MARKRLTGIILILMLAAAGIVWTFTNLSLDEGYETAMAYRFLSGDRLVFEMWEPHQTSAFLTAFLMSLFHGVTGTYEGVILFLHACGIVLRGLVAFFIFKVLKTDFTPEVSGCAAAFFFMISPKDLAMPEFSNLQVWFGALCFLFIILYFRKKNMLYLILSALSLCFEIIAYPSCIIVFIPAMLLIRHYADPEDRARALILYTSVCVVAGFLFLSFVRVAAGPGDILEALENILNQEPSHTVSLWGKFLAYFKDLAWITAVVVGIVFIAIKISSRICGKDAAPKRIKRTSILISNGVMLVLFLVNIISAKDRCFYGILFYYLIILGFVLTRELPFTERRVFYTGTYISIAGFAATLLLTDLPIIVSSPYLVLAVALSVIPIGRFYAMDEDPKLRTGIRIAVFAFVFLLFARCIYIRTPLTGREQICSVLNTDLSLIRKGPAKGMITDDFGARKQVDSYDEFRNLIPEGSNVWIVDTLCDNLGYMYGDYMVSAPSVISDPKFVPGFDRYWNNNPRKLPDVVAVSAYEGELSYEVSVKEAFMKWLKEEYRPVRTVYGRFYHYYFRE
ncbi:MAG: hypothetical protein K6E19_07620 [Lachnospiraceae bacterium]|nr:hypothetical protein [Lachnospiraceae bacterium]